MTIKIIWDLDGVIADSERIWIENKRKLLNETYGLNWNEKEAFQFMGGMSDATKRIKLDEMGIITSDEFWAKTKQVDLASMANGEVKITPNVIDIIKAYEGNQCIATGGVVDKTWKKIEAVSLNNYFNETNVFNASMVKHGKPEPDLFLYTLDKMSWDKNEAIIIEDSIAGMTAGLKAGIRTIAYIGNFHIDKEEYRAEIKELGDIEIFEDMRDVKTYLDGL